MLECQEMPTGSKTTPPLERRPLASESENELKQPGRSYSFLHFCHLPLLFEPCAEARSLCRLVPWA